MPERPHPIILNREGAPRLVEEHFRPQIELLSQLANYGSNLMIRAFNSSDKSIGDIIVCGVLLHQLVAMLDAVRELTIAGAIHAAHITARAGMEACFYVEWMLVADLESKAKHYYVATLRQELHWLRRTVAGTRENEEFLAIAGDLGRDVLAGRPKLVSMSPRRIERIELVLAQEAFRQVNARFQRLRDRLGHEVSWHAPLGYSSIKRIAREVGRRLEYDVFYGRGSDVVHAKTFRDYIRIADGHIAFKPIRNLNEIRGLLHFTTATAIGTFRMLVNYYRPQEYPAFVQQYLDEWRDAFLNIKSVRFI